MVTLWRFWPQQQLTTKEAVFSYHISLSVAEEISTVCKHTYMTPTPITYTAHVQAGSIRGRHPVINGPAGSLQYLRQFSTTNLKTSYPNYDNSLPLQYKINT